MRRPLFLAFLVLLSCGRGRTRADDFTALRRTMVRDQIEARGIADTAVLEAMRTVPRHRFVPPAKQALAYEDYPLPIGEGQTISQPYVVALMTDALGLEARDRVLEIGTGSGYQAAVLAELVKQVYTIELIPTLADRAARTLNELGYRNIEVRAGDGYLGWTEHAPFDAIMITCACERLPDSLLVQLAEGGRLIAPIGPEGQTQILTMVTKHGQQFDTLAIAPVVFVPMQGLIRKTE